jgi:DNA polymerase III delta prime subunit
VGRTASGKGPAKAAEKPVILQPSDLLLVLGVRGSGKTTWARDHVWATAKRAVAWDVFREFPTEHRVSPYELADDAEKIMKAGKVAITPDSGGQAMADEFALAMDILSCFGGYVLLVDEVGLLRRYGEATLSQLATVSRHWGAEEGEPGVPVVMLSQRATQIPPTAREQASMVVSFAQRSPDDLDALADRCGDEFAAKVRRCTRAAHDHAMWREDD